MKQTKRIRYLAAFLALLLVPLTLSAQPRRGPGHHQQGGPDGMHRLERMSKHLELDESQVESIRAIMEESRGEAQSLRGQMEDARKAVDDAIQAAEFDESAVRSAAQAAADLGVELAVIRARTAQQIRENLTPEQQEKLEVMRSRRKEMGGHRRGPRGRRGRRHLL